MHLRRLRESPGRADIVNDLGGALLALNRVNEAIACYEFALRHQPDFVEAHYNLGSAFVQQDEVEKGAACFLRAAELRPEKVAWRFRSEILWPPVFRSRAEIAEYRARLNETLDRHARLDWRLEAEEVAPSGCVPPFNLAHQGAETLTLKREFAAVFERSVPAWQTKWLGNATGNLGSRKPSGGRQRVGFVVTRGHEPIFLRCMAGVVNRLPPDLFESLVFCSPEFLPLVRQAIPSPLVHVQPLPPNFPGSVQAIAAAECETLYYWEVGTDAINYFLPFLRLAPRQITSWGTLVTAAVPEIDAYLASGLAELDGAERNYGEQLMRLDSLLGFVSRTGLPSPASICRETVAREMGAEGKNLYVCSQNPLKLHPDFDELIAGILRRDRHGIVVLKEGMWPRAGILLRERLAASVPDVADRVRFWPFGTHDKYLELLAGADVLLDTPHYGAGSTTYEIFSFAQPIVTWPGRFHVGRYTQACYRRMGVEAPIVDSAERYVETAVRLATDVGERNALRRLIAERSAVLFEDQDVVDSHVRFLGQPTLNRPSAPVPNRH